jgi:hypothetical protein
MQVFLKFVSEGHHITLTEQQIGALRNGEVEFLASWLRSIDSLTSTEQFSFSLRILFGTYLWDPQLEDPLVPAHPVPWPPE